MKVPDSDINFVPKGWGHELWICNSEKYCGKILFINKSKKLSWHYHLVKDEHFYVQKGHILVYYGYDDDISKCDYVELKQGDIFYCPPGLRHRMQAIRDTYLFEFSTEHKDEDSIRIEKGD